MKGLYLFVWFVRDFSIKNLHFAAMKTNLSHRYETLTSLGCLMLIYIFPGLGR